MTKFVAVEDIPHLRGKYTSQQVVAINAAIRRAAETTHPNITQYRPDGLNRHDLVTLVEFAESYRISIKYTRSPRSRMTPRAEKNLLRISWLCGELLTAVKRIEDAEFAAELEIALAVLFPLKEWAEHSARIFVGEKVTHKASGRQPTEAPVLAPLGEYYFRIVVFWASIGGEIKFSRSRSTKLLTGPLIEFIDAVANPVLGSDALKNTSLQKAIEFYKKCMQCTSCGAGAFDCECQAGRH